ncbi:MAG: CRTAC1 family protein [Verrucomicrobiales bacterium]
MSLHFLCLVGAWWRISIIGALVAAALVGSGCQRPPSASLATTLPGETAAGGAVAPAVFNSKHLFTEVTAERGFEQNPPHYPEGTFMTPEITPGGVAVFDYDNDGLLDILVIRHPAPTPWAEQLATPAPNRLFRQKTDHRFEEVAGAAGLGGKGFHHGVAIGDVNNDGFCDVYLCNFGGPDEFFVNNGHGAFTDATASAGFLRPANPLLVSKDNWSSTAAFFDCDADGDLDLWVVHFATFDPARKCKTTSSADELDYCGPHTYPGQLAALWRNKGRGVFTEITAQAGIAAAGRGWGVIAADLTGDGLADVLQANDEEPNQLWVNQGDGTFSDEALLRGCAVNAFGSVEANMGIAVGDTRNLGGGHIDLLMTHFAGETNTFWASQGEGLFADLTSRAGMGLIDRPFTGWGCGFFDFDNDGFLDLAVANGRVARGPVRPEADAGPFWNRFAEPNLLFRGDGTGKFLDTREAAGDFTRKLEVHRALAFADLGNRGALDLLCVNLDNTLRIFRNDAVPPGHHWLQVLPMTGPRDAIGARVTIAWSEKKRSALCLRAYSYLASNDPRVHFGLGQADKVEVLEILWPSGTPRRERFEVSGVNRLVLAHQGSGIAL